VTKKTRDKKPVFELLVGIGGRHWKLTPRWRVYYFSGWRVKQKTWNHFYGQMWL